MRKKSLPKLPKRKRNKLKIYYKKFRADVSLLHAIRTGEDYGLMMKHLAVIKADIAVVEHELEFLIKQAIDDSKYIQIEIKPVTDEVERN